MSCFGTWTMALQRGRRRSSPEGRDTLSGYDSDEWLQRGRRRSSPEGSWGSLLSEVRNEASTGPATFIAGRAPMMTSDRQARIRFNGAGDVHRRKATLGAGGALSNVLLQRGRRRSSPEGPDCPEALVNTWPLQRGRRRSSPEPSSPRGGCRSCFNGAGDVHRRKDLAGPCARLGRRGASTGPATFIAGRRQRQRRARQRAHAASTGPATFIAGRPLAVLPARQRLGCFNGAGDVHRRKADRHDRGRSGRRGFNGAGDVHRRKAPAIASARDVPSSLQRGRRRSSPEGRRPRCGPQSARQRFNGAGDVHRRKARTRRPRRASAPRFNGAGDVHRRKGRR